MKKYLFKKLSWKNKLTFGFAIILVIALAILALSSSMSKEEISTPEISIKATLEKIVKISNLSTFEATYNGIAKVMNEKKSEKVDFYVSYEATVKAGIDVEAITILIDDNSKNIYITLPDVKITSTNVNIESLDYIFENDKANNENVSAIAYKACIADVENEASTEDAIFELAKENAQNIISALISPFTLQYNSEYKIIFN